MAVKFRDYYEVLGVARDASEKDIKRAYRQLARKHHPDLQPPDQRAKASERFKEINEAYEVLSDPEKRARYDSLGESYREGQDFSPPPGWRPQATPEDWGEDLGGFSDFFASIFGGAAGARGGPRPGRGGGVRFSIPGSDIEAELPVSIEDLLHGARRRLSLDGDRSLEVTIPVGAREGTVLRLAGQGEPGFGGGPRGDLYLRLRAAPHARYRVTGDDLEADLSLWPWQAALGAQVKFETPENLVSLKVPAGTSSGKRLRLRGLGLPKEGGARGDLYAVVRIVVAEHLSAEEKAAYEALQRAQAPADRPASG
ncbi:MAG TPA: J domain-containing protein [Candidatus Eisenbacteria bacterium]|nr:J domain-containing protein [Candidatus Eisenbacteria bacterium]